MYLRICVLAKIDFNLKSEGFMAVAKNSNLWTRAPGGGRTRRHCLLFSALKHPFYDLLSATFFTFLSWFVFFIGDTAAQSGPQVWC